MSVHTETLTPTELEVLELLLSGVRVQDVALRRARRVSTIRWHVRQLHTKTETHSLSELVLWGVHHSSCCLLLGPPAARR